MDQTLLFLTSLLNLSSDLNREIPLHLLINIPRHQRVRCAHESLISRKLTKNPRLPVWPHRGHYFGQGSDTKGPDQQINKPTMHNRKTWR